MKLLLLSLLLITLQVNAQQYPIAGITITLPQNPDAIIANWKGGTSMLTISAMARLVNGRPDVRVEDSKILVIIKKSGGKICGTFTNTSAPSANFTTANKVWSGNNAVALLGQDCTLPPGDYELSVQLFGNGPRGLEAISDEKSRTFTIRGNEQQSYQPPQLLSPVDGTVMSESDRRKPITFRWTPVIPKPVDPVTYRLRVWQLMEGQNATQAIIQPPLLGNDVGQYMAIVRLPTPPPGQKNPETYVWNVQALNRDGKPIGENNGTSATFTITVRPVNDEPVAIKLATPANKAMFSAGEKIRFSWSSTNAQEDVHYTLKIKEILLNQSPYDAIHTNKPHFEKDSLKELSFQTTTIFTAGKRYAWSVEAKEAGGVKITESEINEFIISGNKTPVSLSLVAPANNSMLKSNPVFSWRFIPGDYDGDGYFKIKIVEIKGDESPDNAIRTNKPFFEKDSLNYFKGNKPIFEKDSAQGITRFSYPSSGPRLLPGKYVWNVQALDRDGKPIGENNGTSRTFTITVNPINDAPVAIKLTSPGNGSVLAADPTFRWTVVPGDYNGDGYYKIKIVEIKGDQSPEQAFKGNKPFFEKDSLKERSLLYPSSAPKLEEGKRYAWNIQSCEECTDEPNHEREGRRNSETFTFRLASKEGNQKSLKLIAPGNGAVVNGSPVFRWSGPVDDKNKGNYKIKIVEIKGDESPEQAFKGNKPFFEKDSCKPLSFQYPSAAPKLQTGKRYAWAVTSGNVQSSVWAFNPGPERPDCKRLKVSLVKNDRSSGKDACCYDINITNEYKGSPLVTGFRVLVKGFSVVSAPAAPKEWQRKPEKFPNESNNITWTKPGTGIPTGKTSLGTICLDKITKTPFYFVYEWLDAGGKTICKDSVQVAACSDEACRNNIIRNGGFVLGNNAGIMPAPGSIQQWTNGYGAPVVNNDTADGFIEKGCVKLSGNATNGQALAQSLDPNNKIIQGKKYKISLAVRFKANENNGDYVKIRVIAFNGSISSGTATHPGPSTDVAIIGRSGKIKDCGDWSIIEMGVWTAGKDFSNIAVNAFTNDNTTASVWIDNITTCESTQSACDEVQTDTNGEPIMPAGYGTLPPGTACTSEAEEEEYFNGSLQDLYPGYNGTSSIYANNPDNCFSIGGTIPPAAQQYNCDDSLKAAGIDMTCEEFAALLQQDLMPGEHDMLDLPVLDAMDNFLCDRGKPVKSAEPFNGRDIIYIHGLQLSHLIDRSIGTPGATGNWPANQNEYYNGYYKIQAYNNMAPHIFHFLRNRGYKNRFLVVVYDCSESAEVAVHAVLTQIREAMQNGKGVQVDSTDARGRACFGRDYVFISHSTGALIADVALSIASKTKTPGYYQSKYGNVGLISDRCKGRMSIQGAISGSNLAKIALLGQALPPSMLNLAFTALSFTPVNLQNLNANPALIANSVLVDLTPEITRARWGSLVNDVPVPVFSIAGAHPSAILGPLKYIIHPGFDDGVLTMDCVNGNNNPLAWGPSSITANPVKLFDMGIPTLRAVKYYLDRRIAEGIFATTSTAYLSSTGMVDPVGSILVNPQNHFKNHYSFIQSTKEHWFNATEPGSGNTSCDYGKTSPGNAVNNEEMLVVSDPSVFSPSLVDPSIISQMGETLKDKHILYPTIKIVVRHGIPRPSIVWKKFFIWKRTYHKLVDNCMYDVDYGYKYLFRQ